MKAKFIVRHRIILFMEIHQFLMDYQHLFIFTSLQMVIILPMLFKETSIIAMTLANLGYNNRVMVTILALI